MKGTKDEGIAVALYRCENWLYKHHFILLAHIVYRFMQIFLGCTIPYTVEIGSNVKIPHFHGIVIHHEVTIGDETVLYQNICLGGRNGKRGPSIGNNCIIGPGACVLGPIKIGNNVYIGANAVVLNDIPDGTTVVCEKPRIIEHTSKV